MADEQTDRPVSSLSIQVLFRVFALNETLDSNVITSACVCFCHHLLCFLDKLGRERGAEGRRERESGGRGGGEGRRERAGGGGGGG